MGFELAAGLIVFLAVIVWRFARGRTMTNRGPLPNVADAPASAKPVLEWRYGDDGFSRSPAEIPERGPRQGDG